MHLLRRKTLRTEQTLSKLPLEKKGAQLVLDIAGGYLSEQDPRLLEWMRLAREGVSEIVTYGGTPRDLAVLLNRLQKEAPLPLLMAADFEGGPGQQPHSSPTFAPGNNKAQLRHLKPSGLEPEMEVAGLLSTILKVNLSERPATADIRGIHPSRRRNVS
jgi:hypothetical protein